jgi:hypothetical protein
MTADQVRTFREYVNMYRYLMDKKGPTAGDFIRMGHVHNAVVAAFHADGCSTTQDRIWLAAVRLWGKA